MNNYCIYMHRNTKNGKLYFGQTCQIVEQRWKNGKGYDKCPNFWNAIIAEGWNNFEHIVLDTELSKEQADEKEKLYSTDRYGAVGFAVCYTHLSDHY